MPKEVSRGRIPLYYGGSFAYIAPVVAVAGASWGGLQVAQVGIVATGLLNIIVGLIVQRVGCCPSCSALASATSWLWRWAAVVAGIVLNAIFVLVKTPADSSTTESHDKAGD